MFFRAGTVRDIHSVYNVTEEEMGLVNELADFAAKKLDEIDADNKKNIIDKVLNPTKQVSFCFSIFSPEFELRTLFQMFDALVFCGQSFISNLLFLRRKKHN